MLIENHFEIILITLIFLFFFIFAKYNFKIAFYLNLLDKPDKKLKLHHSNVPLTGGLLIFGIYFIFVLCKFLYFNLNFNSFLINNIFLLTIFSVGIIDDKFNLSPNIKLFILVLIIITFLNLNNFYLLKEIYISSFNVRFNIFSINFFITTLSILLFINASNMFDGIDGQSGIYFLTIFTFLSLITGFNTENLIIIVSIFLFLILNLKKKLFLGDSGVFFLSTLFSLLVIENYQINKISAEQIFLLMMLPGIDMLRLFLERILKKKNPFKGDRNHLHHLLLKNNSQRLVLIKLFSLIIIPNFLAYFLDLYLILIVLTLLVYLFTIFKFKSSNA